MTTGVRHRLGARALAENQYELVKDEAGDQPLAQEDYGHGLADSTQASQVVQHRSID